MLISHMMTTESDMQKDSNQMEQSESESSTQNLGKLIDDCFYIKEQRWGTWNSIDKDGKGIITALTEDECVRATRWYLKGLQEGFEDTPTHEGTVGGKL
jgi:hypothetical protein